MNQDTYQIKTKEIKRDWHLVDAKGETLGRLATKIATLLIGKNKVSYTPHMDSGDYVVVVNSKEVAVTGRKRTQKIYHTHSGYPKGLKTIKFEKLVSESPEKVIKWAVSGMLPKNRLRNKRLARLKIFASSEHTYKDQLNKKEK